MNYGCGCNYKIMKQYSWKNIFLHLYSISTGYFRDIQTGVSRIQVKVNTSGYIT